MAETVEYGTVNPPASHKKKKKGGGVWRVVFWVSLVVFIGAVAALGYIAWGYISADQGYKKVAQEAFTVIDNAEVQTSQVEEAPEPEAVGLALGDLEVDWDHLRSINPDVKAWIYMPGTRINYPVVLGRDNNEYLWTDFNRASSRCGSIFLDSSNTGTMNDANNVFYGHHMNDGSMFACISLQLTDNEEFNKHRTVYVLTPQLNYKCTTFSVLRTNGSDLLVQTSFKDEAERSSYVQDKMTRSVVQPSEGMPKPADIKQLITLSTCDYTQGDGRAVMFAHVVETAVPADHSEVSEEDLAALNEGVAVADQ